MEEEVFCITADNNNISIKLKGDFNELSLKLSFCMKNNEVVRDIVFDALREFLNKKMDEDFKIHPN